MGKNMWLVWWKSKEYKKLNAPRIAYIPFSMRAWHSAELPVLTRLLLRQTRRNMLEDSKLANNILLFEYITNIHAQENQVATRKFIVGKMLKPDRHVWTLIQQIMSNGKSKVVLPLIITLLLNREESLPPCRISRFQVVSSCNEAVGHIIRRWYMHECN
jgi:hypothetical protein